MKSTKRIYVYEPVVTPADVAAVHDAAASGWISSKSPYVDRFEQSLARFVGTKEAVATMNGTVALHLILAGLGIGHGDEVIVPALTFVATAAAVRYTGARPVFADVRESDWNLDPAEVARVRTRRTKAVIAVHLYGNPCDCRAVERAAPGAVIVEDAAEALGASVRGRHVGSLGRAAAFSFYGNKIITTGEGGMVLTDDKKLATRMRFLRDHAMDAKRRYYHPEIGWNYRITGLQAAVGYSQMRRVREILSIKDRIARGYARRLRNINGVTTHPVRALAGRGVCWMYSILLPDRKTRDGLMRHLDRAGIETRPFFIPVPDLPPYRAVGRFPVSRSLSQRGMNLPSGPGLSARDLDRVCAAVREFMKGA